MKKFIYFLLAILGLSGAFFPLNNFGDFDKKFSNCNAIIFCKNCDNFIMQNFDVTENGGDYLINFKYCEIATILDHSSGILGQQITILKSDADLNEITRLLGAKSTCAAQQFDGFKTYYYFSNYSNSLNFLHAVCDVNLQIAEYDTYFVVGFPLILGYY